MRFASFSSRLEIADPAISSTDVPTGIIINCNFNKKIITQVNSSISNKCTKCTMSDNGINFCDVHTNFKSDIYEYLKIKSVHKMPSDKKNIYVNTKNKINM